MAADCKPISKGEVMLLAERTKNIAASSTSRMREIANDLKKSGIDIINFGAGELDGDADDAIKSAAKAAIDSVC
jgi:aspartate aminotransferase